ncbi:hypothetical protein SAMN05444007_107270 [Cribrihabitans marinus]|uniref:Tetratricopeptide repeat-containing protein n=1 Tax=Cribrihabitans marinus TaxID=1227549 RepID=A0A1H7C0V7_9RHOB|nr:hypothetical protein [Cribrihabitans marinus]GGH33156.1 hypothetical protein GCM10010973_25050 [Cribrihabitans marinus]SEJ83096.1 hypothetical protein SAMN05444007_107270 [Cribrihabitans marinus]
MKLLIAVLTLCLLGAPVFADSDGETEAAQHTAEVNAVIETVTELLEEARQTAPTDRSSALRAYLLLREADAVVTRALAAYPEADSLGELEAHPAAQLQDGPIAAAAGHVVSLCDGLPPRDCLFTETERVAAQIVQTSRYVPSRAMPLSDIAEARAKVGQLAEAKRFWSEAERIVVQPESAINRASELQVIAGAQAGAENMAEATRLWSAAERSLTKIKRTEARASALSHIAKTRAAAGQLAEATRFWSEAERIVVQPERRLGRSKRAWALYRIAGSLAQSGQFTEAERIAVQIEGNHQSWALRDIAGSLAEAAKYAEAERIAVQLARTGKHAGDRAKALSLIASEL